LTAQGAPNKLFNVASNIVEAQLPTPVVSQKPENAAPSTAGMTTKVVKGSLWTLMGQMAPLGVSLFTTPFVIRLLGSEGYGVLVLIALIPTYFGFADFGMGIASTKFGSEAYGQGDKEKEASIVRTAALIALMASLPIAAGLFVFSPQIIGLFNIPEPLYSEASLALKLASITFVVNFLNNVFNTPQLTRLRMDLNTFVNAGFRICGIIATPIVIYLGGGIAGAVAVLLAASLLTLSGHLFISGRLQPKLLAATTIDLTAIKSLTKFGGALVISGIAAIILVNAEKGILAATVSASALAHYSVAFTLAGMMTMFSSAMIQSLLPAFSQLQADENRGHLNSLYSRGIRLNLIWLIPTLAFLSIIAKPFFTLWAGEEFGRESVLPFYVLLAGIAFNIIAYFPNTAIMAAGRTDMLAKLYWIELAPYILLVLVLSSRFGAVGAAAAWSIRVIIDAFLQFFLAKRVARISYVQKGLMTFSVAGTVMALPFAVNLYLGEFRLVIALLVLASIILYSFIIWKALLEREEVSWLLHRFRKVV
jgi:Membrane protein involved in the export of O-antigen and teichoic acid